MSLRLTLAAPLALVGPALAGVRTVAPSGADHVQITQAIAASAPGDVVLVQSGSYAAFTLSGLPLQVVAEEGANVVVHGQVVVRDIPAGECALLAGLRLAGAGASALLLRDVAGAVRVSDVQAWIAPGFVPAGLPTVRVEGCADVAFSRCTLHGAAGTAPALAAGTALAVAASAVTFDGGTAAGGLGASGSATSAPGGAGGAGIDAPSGEVSLSGALVAGGAGGPGGVLDQGPGCVADAPRAGGPGGVGLRAGDAATVRTVGTATHGGPGGAGGTTACGLHGAQGPAGPARAGPIVDLRGAERSLRAPRLAREGEILALELEGVPGERAFVFLSDRTAQSWSAPLAGCRLIGLPPLRRILAGEVPASGLLGATWAAPELGPAVSARTLHAQALFVARSGRSRLSGARALVLVDRIY